MAPSSTEESPFTAGVKAARSLVLPALILFATAAILVTAYYRSPSVATAMNRLSEIKKEMGPAFAFISTATLGGIVPWLFRMGLPTLRPKRPGAELAFGILWWGPMGLVLDAFYRFLGHLYDGLGWPVAAVIVAKVASDMLVFTPAYASPANALSHLWKDLGFSFPALRTRLGRGWYRRLVLPNLIPNFFIWIPGVAFVYAMPGPLQLPMSNLIGCFWSLMCLQLAAHTAKN